jgi:hypothetical protein
MYCYSFLSLSFLFQALSFKTDRSEDEAIYHGSQSLLAEVNRTGTQHLVRTAKALWRKVL